MFVKFLVVRLSCVCRFCSYSSSSCAGGRIGCRSCFGSRSRIVVRFSSRIVVMNSFRCGAMAFVCCIMPAVVRFWIAKAQK